MWPPSGRGSPRTTRHYVLKITQEGGREPAALAFSEFDQEFVVEAPPAKDVLRS